MTTAQSAAIVLNVLAFAGAGAFLMFHADERRRSPVDTRLSAIFLLLMALVGVRAMRWALEAPVLQRIEEALAAAMPLVALFLAEGLMRRHAPSLMKRVFLIGSVGVALLALLRPNAVSMEFTVMLGVLVAGGLAATALLLFLRDRRSLSPSENAAISAMGLGLLAALPFVAGDFLYAAGLSPWRAGGIALLLFVYATARLTATGAGGTAVLADLALAVFGAGVAFMTLVALVGPPDLVTGGAWLLVIFGIVLVILIVQALRERDTALGRQELLTALADAPPAPLDAFIDHVLASPMLARATVLEGAGLSDFNDARVRACLDATPVVTIADARQMGGSGEPLVALMETHEATHVVVLARTPLRLLVVNMSGLSSGPDVAVQLTLLHRLAMAAERTT
ncbi:MAG: hypothetical protein IV086_12805 [Hyphomonadaceae bacterium]|nr:hypothetical protein [Hyphomonadaceae bacterium]